MIPYTEALTFLGSGFMSFWMRYSSERAKERKEQFEMALGKHKALEESSNAAVKRVPLDGGKVNRRAIVFALLFSIILAPFVLALLNTPIYVETVVEKREWLFGLIGGGSDTEWVRVDGFVMFRSVTHLFSSISGFYFGNSVAKK